MSLSAWIRSLKGRQDGSKRTPPLLVRMSGRETHEFLLGLEVLRLGKTVRRERLPLSSESAVMETVWYGR